MKNKTVKISTLVKLSLIVGVVYGLMALGDNMSASKHKAHVTRIVEAQVANYQYNKAHSKWSMSSVVNSVRAYSLEVIKMAMSSN